MVEARRRKRTKQNLIAVYFMNGLGNFIMMTPAIQALANLHDANVDIVLDDSWTDSRRPAVEEFCKTWSLINEVVKFGKDFDKSKYKQLFFSYHGERSDAFNYFVKNCGFEAKHVNWRAEKLHEVDFYMNDVFNLGYKGKVPSQYCITGGGAGIANDQGLYGDNRFIKIGFCNGFFAGSRWQWERKAWPHFPELAKALARFINRQGLKILLFGKGNVDYEWSKTVLSVFKENDPRVYNLVNRTHIAGTIQMMRKCDLFITTDTGLMHVADAIKIPMIALFGATMVSKNGPYNKTHKIARSPLNCVPCQQNPMFLTCKEWRCMKVLTAGMVMSVVREYLAELIKAGKLGMSDERPNELKPCLINW